MRITFSNFSACTFSLGTYLHIKPSSRMLSNTVAVNPTLIIMASSPSSKTTSQGTNTLDILNFNPLAIEEAISFNIKAIIKLIRMVIQGIKNVVILMLVSIDRAGRAISLTV